VAVEVGAEQLPALMAGDVEQECVNASEKQALRITADLASFANSNGSAAAPCALVFASNSVFACAS